MKRNDRKLSGWILAALGMLLLSANPMGAQEFTHNDSPGDTSATAGALADVVLELRAQVDALNAEVKQLRAETESARKELQALHSALDAPSSAKAEKAEVAPSSGNEPSSVNGASESSTPSSAEADQAVAQTSADARLERMQEDIQLTDSKVDDEYQTKVESGSKYRLRLSGIVLMNLFANRGNADNLDIPQIAVAQPVLGSKGSFGATLRQSQIGLEIFGPNVGAAHTSADVKFDFAGGFPSVPNGIAFGQMRLRTGTVRIDWANTSIVAGQDTLFFAPLAPSSIATLAVPPLSYSGNLWAWIPQVRAERRVTISEQSSVSFAAGILDSFSGDIPESEYDRPESWGEESGQPAYAARIAWTHQFFGQNLTVGSGGYYGRQNWGLGRSIDGWAGTTDLTLPIGKYFALTGEFYRARAAAGIGAGRASMS